MVLTLVRTQPTYKIRVVESVAEQDASLPAKSASKHAGEKMTLLQAQEMTREEILAAFSMSGFKNGPSDVSYTMEFFDPYKGWKNLRTIIIPS